MTEKGICAICEETRELHRCDDLPLEQYEEDPYSGTMMDISQNFGYWHNQLVCDECQRDVDKINEEACIWAHKEINAIKERERGDY